MISQLEQIGVFDQAAGVLLGTFTQYEKANLELSVFDLLKMHISDTLPVAQTNENRRNAKRSGGWVQSVFGAPRTTRYNRQCYHECHSEGK